jgi:hypothetical protein
VTDIEHIFFPTIDKTSNYRVCNERDEKSSQRGGEEMWMKTFDLGRKGWKVFASVYWNLKNVPMTGMSREKYKHLTMHLLICA